MSASERSIVDAFTMAFDEINERGGLLGGRKVEVLVRDGQSNEDTFAQLAEELIAKDRVVTLFGCWRSPCRKTVEAACRRLDHLLLYPMTYEGLEESPYVVYLGGAPNQHILPTVKWAFAFLNKRKFYLIGADGIYSNSAHAIIRDELASLGGEVVGETFKPLGCLEFQQVARDVAASGADVVINTVTGSGNIALFGCLREAGIRADKVPTLSLKVSEEELQSISSPRATWPATMPPGATSKASRALKTTSSWPRFAALRVNPRDQRPDGRRLLGRVPVGPGGRAVPKRPDAGDPPGDSWPVLRRAGRRGRDRHGKSPRQSPGNDRPGQ